MKKTIAFISEHTEEPIVFELSAPDTEKNIVSLFEKACDEAAQDGFRDFNYKVPKKYLSAFGLKLKRLRVSSIDIEKVGFWCMQVTPCACRQCSAYEEGNCFRYGGTVDGFSIGDDCLHGTGGYKLFYGDSKVSGIIFETKLEPDEAVEYILNSDEEPLEELKEDILKFLDDEGIDTPEKELWNFEEDM